MKSKSLLVTFIVLILTSCTAQNEHRQMLKNSKEVKSFIRCHPYFDHSDLLNFRFTDILFNEAITALGFSGLIFSAYDGGESFNKELDYFTSNYTETKNLDKVSADIKYVTCNESFFVPDLVEILAYSDFQVSADHTVYLYTGRLEELKISEKYFDYAYACDSIYHGNSAGYVIDNENGNVFHWILFW